MNFGLVKRSVTKEERRSFSAGSSAFPAFQCRGLGRDPSTFVTLVSAPSFTVYRKPTKLQNKKNKCLVVKGVPTDLTEEDFKEFLDLNKISYAKAERYKSKKTAGSCQCFNSKLVTLLKPRLSFHKI